MTEASTFRQTDLRTAIPTYVIMGGLSSPHFDGVNFFRVPTAPISTISFKSADKQFVQLEYQLYSPAIEVLGVLRLDGRELDHTTFPAGQFIPKVMAGAFISAGPHSFTLEYRCQDQPCDAPLSQYWTRLDQLPYPDSVDRQDAGLGVERWWLNAPDSPLKITGAGPLYFDGTNFVRRLTDQEFELSWPHAKALNASMWIYAPQSFRVTTRIGGEILSVQNGNKSQGVTSAVSLTGKSTSQSLTVRVDCLESGAVVGGKAGNADGALGCAFLYFPQVAVLTAPPATAVQTGGAAVATLLLIAGLWRWFGLALERRAATG